MGEHTGEIYSFAEFIFDPHNRELLYKGRSYPLPDQDARLLGAFLAQPNQAISREQLARLLWPEGENVDFDRAINNVISRLRRLLNDDARDPRFIRTVPKLGYRF